MRAEEEKTRRTKRPQDHLQQDIWWFLYQICQVIEKFTTQLLTLCLLGFMIWMLGLFVIANALNTAVTFRSTRTVGPSSNKSTKEIFNSVLSARNHKPNNKPDFQRKPNIPIHQFCPITSPRSSIKTYVNSVLSGKNHQRMYTFERIADDRRQKLRIVFCREWNSW